MNNNILASFFTPSQTLTIIIVSVVVVLLIVLNVVLAYVFNKRGERRLIDKLLQQQRDLLMQQLDDMHKKGAEFENNEEPYRPFFKTEIVYKEVIKEVPVERIIERVSEQPAVEQPAAVQPAVEQPAVEVEATAVEEKAIEENIEQLPERAFETFEEVTVQEVDEVMSDEEAQKLVEEEFFVKNFSVGKKKAIINVDILSRNFEAGAHVNIEILRERKLIAKDAGTVKILAKGSLNKSLVVEADDFSLEAVKMIVLTGGRAIKTTSLKQTVIKNFMSE